ncbi:MAG: methyltransferase domain-containing protein [Deltaproteobacteria bacterium]|nr:methyltransferase domain-containing protein [Deltaproteobacteria bacterium]
MDDTLIAHLPPPFNYYRLISDSDHLHFGLWPEGRDDLSVEKALENMFARLVQYLPRPPARILDVGCGLGLSAHILRSSGYAVTAIAPSEVLIDYAEKRYGQDGVDFIVLNYFDDDPACFSKARYDALFFQESLQYLHPLSRVMERARFLLKDRGVMVIGDEVCYDACLKSETSIHSARKIYAALSEKGFVVTENRKLGKQVLPTCDVACTRLTDRFEDILSRLSDPDAEDNLRFFLKGWQKQKAWHHSGRLGYEIFAAKKDSFCIRPYIKGDEHELLPLFNEAFNTRRGLDHWYWKYQNNPYGAHRIGVGISGEGDIVSQYAGYPVPFCDTLSRPPKPVYFLTVHAGDTFTHPKIRRMGLGKTGLLARTTFYYYAEFLEEFVPFAYGFNTAKIKKLGERYLGYRYGPPVTLWKRDRDAPLKAGSLLRKVWSGLKVEEVFSVDGEWDEFFDRVCPSYGFLVKRDAQYLKWRYLNCPDRPYRIFAVRKRGKLTGWGVFLPRDDGLLWGDALFDKDFPECVAVMLRRITDGYVTGAKTIEGWFSPTPGWWSGRLTSMGFEPAPEPDGLTLCYRTFSNAVMDSDSVAEKLDHSFYYTWGDSDLF